MKIAEFSVKNSLLVNLVSVFIILIGSYSMMKMRREAFPPVDYDIVTITTVWPGAPTEDVEKFVTIPLEKEIKSVSGIDKMNSKSDEGLSEIGIYIDPGVKDKKKVVDDIERSVDRVRDLPQEAEDPEIFELATREFPVLEISISGTLPEKVRRQYAEELEDKLLDVKGVAQVRKYGWRDPEFWVEVDPQQLINYHVSIQEVIEALRTQNVTLPGGQLTTDKDEFNVRTTGEFQTAQEIANVIIRANDMGNWLRVKDVAQVIETFADETTIAKINGEKATAMVVVKSEQGDALDVVAAINMVLDDFRLSLPQEMKITVTNDFSYYVKRRLGVLQVNGVIGFFLVLIILFLFLDPIPAFMTALGIPIAIFSSFMVMSFFDISINLVSMLGIILVLGMLVDDGIIVSENVYRLVEEGMSPRKAAIQGATEVIAPVTATILTTFAFFGPLMFMDDIIGKFIREIPKVVLITLTASLFEAFIILPAHLNDALSFFKGKVRQHTNEKKWYVALKSIYTKSLKFCLQGRYLVMLAMFLCLIFSIWVATHKMRFLLFAGEGIEQFSVRAEAPKGTPLEKTNEMFAPIEKVIAQLPSREMDSFRTFIGGIEEESGFDPNAKRGSHLGQVTVFLTPMQKRDRKPTEIANELKKSFKEATGFEKVYVYIPKEGPPTGSDVEVGIKGEDYSVMEEMSQPFIRYLNGQLDAMTFYGLFKNEKGQITSESQGHANELLRTLKEAGLVTSESKVADSFDQWIKSRGDFSKNLPDQAKGLDSEVYDILKRFRLNAIGVSDINLSYDFGKKQLRVVVDEEKAKKYFLNINQVARSVRNVFKGGVATSIKPSKAEEEIDVLVRFPKKYREDPDVFDNILIPNEHGNLVKLKAVARIEETQGVYKIDHLNGNRVLYVSAQVDKKNVTSLEINQDMQRRFKEIDNDFLGYTVEFGGEFEDQKKTGRNLMISYLFAMFLCYIILVAMFKSLIQPFIVMMAIPFGVIGVILSFWAHDFVLLNFLGSDIGRPLNFFALMGLVGLSGIAVNDSVVLVDFVNRLRARGHSRRESIVSAGQMRLRPVIMTSVTTIGGLVSVAYGIGGGDPFLKPMALAIVWGLLFSTLLTLVGIPCIYAIIDDFVEKILRRQLVKENNQL